MNNPSQIPPDFWEKIKAFLMEKKTGKITLNVKDGQILVLDIQETIRL